MSNGKERNRGLSRVAIKERLDKAMLCVTLASVFVAVISAAAAIWASSEAHKARIEDQRPFLAPSVAEKIGQGPFFRVLIDNKGKTPAKDIRVACRSGVETGNSKLSWDDNDPTTPVQTAAYVHSSIWIKVTCTAPQQYAAAGNGIELGVVRYRDVSNREYTTPFCFTFAVPYTDIDVHQCSETRSLPAIE